MRIVPRLAFAALTCLVSPFAIAAAGDCERLLAAAPAPAATPDAVSLNARAQCWLALGRPATARRLFTEALVQDPLLLQAHAGRAIAAARTGDFTRAKLDLEALKALDPKAAAQAGELLTLESARDDGAATPEARRADLDRAAAAGEPADRLRSLGGALLRSAASHHRRYEEWYQDRLGQLAAAARAEPANVERYVDLAEFLVRESNVRQRSEAPPPAGAQMPWRPWAAEYEELLAARAAADEALKIDARHVRALALKAVALSRLGQDDPADQFVRRLQGAGDSPEAARALAWIRQQRIARWTQQARSLRVPVCTATRPGTARAPRPGELSPAPCPAPGSRDLHLADTLENKAAASRRESATLFQRAAQAGAGRVEAEVFQAEIWLSRNRPADALAVLQKAVQREPGSLEAHGALIDVLAAHGQEDALLRARSAAARLLHTTVAWDLERVWDRIERGRIDEALALLTEAKRNVPDEPRLDAYRAVAHQAAGQTAEAIVSARAALALEEARLAMDDGMAAAGLPRSAADSGLILRLRPLLAQWLEPRGASAEITALRRDHAALMGRLDPAESDALVYTAVLPVSGASVPVSLASLKASAAQSAQASSLPPVPAARPPALPRAADAGPPATAVPRPLPSTAAAGAPKEAVAVPPPQPVRAPEAATQGTSSLPRTLSPRTPPAPAASAPSATPSAPIPEPGSGLDAALAGTWVTEIADPRGQRRRISLEIEAAGSYDIRSEGRVLTHGRIQATAGRLLMTDQSGHTTLGTYRIRPAEPDSPSGARTDILQLTMDSGASQWQRQ
ncbi:MAG: hypothetical protein IPK20_11850 [Betaproteobacteria bacterium]|nr:hypothetical protein [Betaproteobacteria bacterium]